MSELLTKLSYNRSSLISQATEIAQRAVAEGRDLTADEKAAFDQYVASADDIGRRAADLAEGIQRAADLDDTFTGMSVAPANPLSVRAGVLDEVQAALRDRRAGSWEARSTLTTSATLGRHTWHGATLAGPRLLHVVAQIPTEYDLAAVDVNYLRIGSVSAATGVAQGVAATELTSVTGAASTLLRYGRWTDLAEESSIASDAAGSITSVQRRAIARDLDSVLIGLAAADSPVGSSVTGADSGKAIRKALAIVSDNAGLDVNGLTIIAHPGDADRLEAVSPIGGSTLGEATVRYAGASLYYSSAAPPGYAIVISPSSFVYLESMATSFRTSLDLKTSVMTLATSIIAGYGNQIIAGGVQRATL